MIKTITSTLPLIHGGRTHALLRRIKFLEEELGIKDQQIITTNYNANYYEIYRSYLQQKKITKNIDIINIYDYICRGMLHDESLMKKIETEIEIEGYSSEIVPNRNAVRYYYDGQYVLFRKYYDKTRIIQFEDIMTQACKHKIQRNEYNSYGMLHRIIHYSVEKNVKIHEELFNLKGQKYMEKFYSDKTPNLVIGIQIYDTNNLLSFSFSNEDELFVWFFSKVFNDGDTIFNDARLLDYGLLNNTKDTRNFIVVHSNHLTNENKLKKRYQYSISNHDKVSSFLVLTHKQKAHLQQEFNIQNNKIEVIPHFIKFKKVDRNNIKNQFVYIGRIDENKQVDHIVEAFSKFCKTEDQVKLIIYGNGTKTCIENLKKLIESKRLDNKISLKGYCANPETKFNESIASFLTSKTEGFGLVVMESLNAGCPVVSYDLNYGPSDLIKNGKNGILVEQNNINELAKAMKQITQEKFRHVENLPEFSIEAAQENYKNLLGM